MTENNSRSDVMPALLCLNVRGGTHFRTSLEVSDGLGKVIVKHLADTTYLPVR